MSNIGSGGLTTGNGIGGGGLSFPNDTKFKGIIDEHPNSVFAISQRRASGNYSGPAIRVRRNSDDVEMDIGFGSDNKLDINALLSFVGAGDAYVTKYYNQSGAVSDAQQVTASRQAKIVEAGVYLGSVKYDGSNDYYTVAHEALLEPDSFSLSVWIRSVQRTSGGGYSVVVDKPHSTHVSPYYNYHIRLNNAQGPNPAITANAVVDGFGGSDSVSSPPQAHGVWSHYVMTFDQTLLKLYKEGVLQNTKTNPGTINWSGQIVYIGRPKNFSGYMKGDIDEVVLWERALSDAEVLDVYNKGVRT